MTERDRMCIRKVRYLTKALAEEAVGKVLAKHGEESRVYRCPFSRCGEAHWHITTRQFSPELDKGRAARSL